MDTTKAIMRIKSQVQLAILQSEFILLQVAADIVRTATMERVVDDFVDKPRGFLVDKQIIFGSGVFR